MYDLLIAGGNVVDPALGLDGVRDVAIEAGKIAALQARIETNAARQVVDARGLLVTPGLIDLHVHVYPGVSHYGIDPDEHVLASGVTTAVDAGSSGASTFPGFRRYVIEASATRLYAFLNISGMGMISEQAGELLDMRWVDPAAAIRVCERNRDLIQGIKVRMTRNLAGDNALAALRIAREAAEAVGLPVMVHPNDPHCTLQEILAELKEGDIVTHCFHGMEQGIVDASGAVRACVREALDRGVRLDVGHGKGSFTFAVAEKALKQGVIPNTISSDLHVYNLAGPVFDLATTMSKFLLLGMDLSEVVRRCTQNPAEILGVKGQLGTLDPGAIADITILEDATDAYQLEDCRGETRAARRRLIPRKVVKGGRVMGAVARGV